MRRLILGIIGFVATFTSLNGDEQPAPLKDHELFPETPSPDVMYMFPDFRLIPALKLALPSTFVALRSRNPEDERVYWGPVNSLSNYFLTQTVTKNKPIISVKLSNNTNQSELSEENIRHFIKDMLPKMGLKHIGVKFLKWGDYPVVAMENKFQDETIMYAWVGLNSPGGETLLINYLFPNGKNYPTKFERELWDSFLANTKALPEQYTFLVNGQDLQPGYTVVTLGPTRFRVVAEKRKSDGKQLVIVQPLNDKTKFVYKDMTVGEMATKWNYGAKAVKVHGTVAADNCVFDETTTVLLKEVDEFTLNAAELKLNPKVVVLDGEQGPAIPENKKRFRRTRPAPSEKD